MQFSYNTRRKLRIRVRMIDFELNTGAILWYEVDHIHNENYKAKNYCIKSETRELILKFNRIQLTKGKFNKSQRS